MWSRFSSVFSTKTRKIWFGISLSTTLWFLHKHPIYRNRNHTPALPFRVAYADGQDKVQVGKTEEITLLENEFYHLNMRIKELEDQAKEERAKALELQDKKNLLNKQNTEILESIQKFVETIESETELQKQLEINRKVEYYEKYIQQLRKQYLLEIQNQKQLFASSLKKRDFAFLNSQKNLFQLLEQKYNLNLDKILKQQEEEMESRLKTLSQTVLRQYQTNEQLQQEINTFKHLQEKYRESMEKRKKEIEENILLTQGLFQFKELMGGPQVLNFDEVLEKLKMDTQGIPLLSKVLDKVPLEGVRSVEQLKEELGELRKYSGLEGNNLTSQISALFHDYITTPPEGLVQGNDLPSVLSRAHYHLARGSLQNSITEIEALEGPPALTFKDWLDAAKVRLRVELGLKVFAAYVRDRVNEQHVPPLGT